MIRNNLWLLATAAVLALVLAYPTSANQGVPLGRDGSGKAAAATTVKTPAPPKSSTTPAKPPATR